MLRDLDKRDTLVLKGLAISAIVFHNFCHLGWSVAFKMKLTFQTGSVRVFLKALHDPMTAIAGFCSFFGISGSISSSFLPPMVLPRASGMIQPPGGAFYGEESQSFTPSSYSWFCPG